MLLKILALLLTTSLMGEKIVTLQPPILTPETVCAKIVCTRPMREGFANISIERMGRKTIVNCYGHGGNGWQTLFGSVSKTISLYQGDKKSPIRVVGAGCVGLVTAIELARKGYNVAGITTKDLYDTASWNAGGYLAMPTLRNGTPSQQESLDQMSLGTYLTFCEIGKGAHPYLSPHCVEYYPVYCTEKTLRGIHKLYERGAIPKPIPVTLDFGGVKRSSFFEYQNLFLQVTVIMEELLQEVKKRGIAIEYKELHSFQELKEEVIFNCTGVGSRKLLQDTALHPTCGHLLMINDGIDHPYIIYDRVMQDGKEEEIYFFPKHLYVTNVNRKGIPSTALLGGTFIPLSEKSDEMDQREWKKLLDRNRIFFYGDLLD